MRNKLSYLLFASLITVIIISSGGYVKDTSLFAASTPVNTLNKADNGPVPSAKNEFVLDNGLRVIHSETKSSPLVTIQLFSNGGSINEKPSQAGLANMTQVLLLQGTQTMN